MISTQQNHKKQCHEGLGRNYAQTFSLIYSKKPSIFILITKLFVILQPKIGGGKSDNSSKGACRSTKYG